jgi:hypothetical protein
MLLFIADDNGRGCTSEEGAMNEGEDSRLVSNSMHPRAVCLSLSLLNVVESASDDGKGFFCAPKG